MGPSNMPAAAYKSAAWLTSTGVTLSLPVLSAYDTASQISGMYSTNVQNVPAASVTYEDKSMLMSQPFERWLSGSQGHSLGPCAMRAFVWHKHQFGNATAVMQVSILSSVPSEVWQSKQKWRPPTTTNNPNSIKCVPAKDLRNSISEAWQICFAQQAINLCPS